MTDHPIIFSSSMIVALLAGRKQMTRRLAWREIPDTEVLIGKSVDDYRVERDGGLVARAWVKTPWQRVKPGDRLWCRETFCYGPADENPLYYRATDQVQAVVDGDGFAITNKDGSEKSPWRSPLHMPRWASRLTLEVTATKIERLQSISKEDELLEGGAESFEGLWLSLHGKDSWGLNPEVVALTFRVHRCNVDSMPKARAA